jgi:uncharacterized lipoprotein YddW (UPF0748 family)
MYSGSTPRVTRFVLRAALSLWFVAFTWSGVPAFAATPPAQAAWVSSAALESTDGVRRAVAATVAAGIGAIVAPAPLYPDGGPDRFMELLRQAHEHQLLVFASVDIDRATLPNEVPATRSHVVYQHPDWLMIPRALAPELLGIDAQSPEYFGRLARWTRANGADGIYLSPVPDAAPAFVATLIAGVLKRYPVDGVQLEAARYPADDFDYGRSAIEAFRQSIRPSLSPTERTRVDSDEAIDPFAYFNAFPDAWRRFRQSQLTRLIQAVRTAINGTLPGVPVIASVSGAADTDLADHFQDWRVWAERRLIDAVSIRSGATATIVTDMTSLVTIAEAGVSAAGSR